MRSPRLPRLTVARSLAVLTLAVVVGLVGLMNHNTERERRKAWDAIPRAVVRKASLSSSLRAGGRLEPSKKTLIECQLEAVVVSTRGRASSGGGSGTIISIVADGTKVKQDDLLCELDSSEYEELYRQQYLNVERARAELVAARLGLDIAEMSKKEFLDGTSAQTIQNYKGQITLAKQEAERTAERVRYMNRLRDKNYATEIQVANEVLKRRKADIDLDRMTQQFSVFEKFTLPNSIHEFDKRIAGARASLTFEELRCQRNEERLAFLQKQLDYCKIRAPHDGMVIYANDDDDDPPIEVGSRIRFKQDLFYLPDLSHMEVQTLLNESVVHQVSDGMPAQVRVEALSNLTLPGHVASVSNMPINRRDRQLSPDVRDYTARVVLEKNHEDLLPGMSVEIELLTGRKSEALLIPTEALTYEDGRETCYVANPDGSGLIKRPVTLGRRSVDQLEVTAGLSEGEEVVVDPTNTVEASGLPVVEATPALTNESADATVAAALR